MTRLLATALTLLAMLPAHAVPSLPLLGPGRLVGGLHQVALPRGMSIDWLAVRYGVNPIRITRPSWPILRDGLQRGEKLTVDQRRVEPFFDATVSGVVLNIPEAQLYRVEKGKILQEYPVGVSRSDWQAPIGVTRIVSMEKNPVWVVPKSIQDEMEKAGRTVIDKIEAGPGNPLGVRWIGFGNGRYGFHGTTDPTSIKRYASHGCVRMLTPHLLDLYGRVSVGMPVYVTYQPVLVAVNPQGIWLSSYPDVYGRQVDRTALVHRLTEQSGVLNRVDWKAVAKVIKQSDGMVVNVATAGGPLQPKPPATPKPAGTPKPSASTSTKPTVKPTGAPISTPRPTPSPVPMPSADPTPIPPIPPQPTPPYEASPDAAPEPAAAFTPVPTPSVADQVL